MAYYENTYKSRSLSQLRLSTPGIKYIKYDQLRIRRIQKYEHTQPKYDSENPKYAHIWLSVLRFQLLFCCRMFSSLWSPMTLTGAKEICKILTRMSTWREADQAQKTQTLMKQVCLLVFYRHQGIPNNYFYHRVIFCHLAVGGCTNSIFTFLSPFSNIMTRNFPGHQNSLLFQ